MNSKDNVRVIVDAGHGGTDPGAVNGNIYEKNSAVQKAGPKCPAKVREKGLMS